jgi:hypothetical protein
MMQNKLRLIVFATLVPLFVGDNLNAQTSDVRKAYYAVHFHDAINSNAKQGFAIVLGAALHQKSVDQINKTLQAGSGWTGAAQNFVNAAEQAATKGDLNGLASTTSMLPKPLRPEGRDVLLTYIRSRNINPGIALTFAAHLDGYSKSVAIQAMGQVDSKAQNAIDSFLKPVLGVSLGGSISEILAANKSLSIHKLTDAMNSPEVQQAVALIQNASTSSAQAALSRLTADAPQLLTPLLGSTLNAIQLLNPQAKVNSAVSSAIALVNANMDDAAQATDLIAAFASQLDPEVGQLISQMNGSTMQIAGSIASFALGGFDGEALVGSIFGGSSQLFSMFQGGSDSQQAAIGTQLSAISKQLDALSGMITKGFAKIDVQLQEITRKLDEGFDQINTRLTQVDQKIDDLIDQVRGLSTEVRLVSLQLDQYFQAQNQQTLATDISQCTSAWSRHQYSEHPENFFSGDRFDICLNELSQWSASFSSGVLANGAPQSQVLASDFSDPAKMLNAAARFEDPLNSLDNLSTVASQLGNPLPRQGLSPGMLVPNPYVWLSATRAYIQVLLDWRYVYGSRKATSVESDIQGMLAAGQVIQTALTGLTPTPGVNAGPGKVVADVLEAYENNLSVALASLDQPYRKAHALPTSHSEIDLFADENQPVALVEPSMNYSPSHAGDTYTPFKPHEYNLFGFPFNGAYLVPLPDKIIPRPYLVAFKLGLGSIDGSFHVNFNLVPTKQTELEIGFTFQTGTHAYDMFSRVLPGNIWQTPSGQWKDGAAIASNWNSGDNLKQQFEMNSIDISDECVDVPAENSLLIHTPAVTKKACIDKITADELAALSSVVTLAQQALIQHRTGIVEDLKASVTAGAFPSDISDNFKKVAEQEILASAFIAVAFSQLFPNVDAVEKRFYGADNSGGSNAILAALAAQLAMPDFNLTTFANNEITIAGSEVDSLRSYLTHPRDSETSSAVAVTMANLKVAQLMWGSNNNSDSKSSKP